MEIEYKNPFVDLESYEGETIEQKVERIVNNNEPITDSAPQIFTERKDGVQAAYNVRTYTPIVTGKQIGRAHV